MRSNGLLKWLMIPVAVLVLFVAIRLFSGGSTSAPPTADAGAKLTPAEMKALGIEGDTPRDTVATLVAQVKQLRTELQTALSDNKSPREETQRLRKAATARHQVQDGRVLGCSARAKRLMLEGGGEEIALQHARVQGDPAAAAVGQAHGGHPLVFQTP